MALIDPASSERLPIPHEPGEWVELRPIPWRVFGKVRSLKEQDEAAARLIQAAIVAWSYAEPVCPEMIDRLDIATSNWIAQEIGRINSVDDSGEASAAASRTSISGVAAGQTN